MWKWDKSSAGMISPSSTSTLPSQHRNENMAVMWKAGAPCSLLQLLPASRLHNQGNAFSQSSSRCIAGGLRESQPCPPKDGRISMAGKPGMQGRKEQAVATCLICYILLSRFTYSREILFGSRSFPVPWLTTFMERESFSLSSFIWKRKRWNKTNKWQWC